MIAAGEREKMTGAHALLHKLGKKGVQLWSERGELRYRAPRGVLSQEELEHLRTARAQLLSILAPAAASSAEPVAVRAPLSWSQLAHWRLNRLDERPSLREVASAMLLRGSLDVDLFRSSVKMMSERHLALRTQIVREGGDEPHQIVGQSPCLDFEVQDLSQLSTDAQKVAMRQSLDRLILTPIRVATDPLFGIRLLRMSAQEHVLLVAMEHMISDGASLLLLLRELSAAYESAVCGRPCTLTPVRMQFTDYASWRRRELGEWTARHGTWLQRAIARWPRQRFPVDPTAPATAPGWGMASISIDRALKAELTEWSRIRRTTVVMSVLTAYVALVLRLCGSSEGIVQYQMDNRSDGAIESTIGYCASVLYLGIELPEDFTFLDLLGRVTHEWCEAFARADHSYIASLAPAPEFAKNTCFNWIAQPPPAHEPDGYQTENTLTWSRVPFEHPAVERIDRDNEPEVLLFDLGAHVEGTVFYPRNRWSPPTAGRFARNFLRFIVRMLRQPDQKVHELHIL